MVSNRIGYSPLRCYNTSPSKGSSGAVSIMNRYRVAVELFSSSSSSSSSGSSRGGVDEGEASDVDLRRVSQHWPEHSHKGALAHPLTHPLTRSLTHSPTH